MPDEVLAVTVPGTYRSGRPRARRAGRGGPVAAVMFVVLFGAAAPVALQMVGIGNGLALYDGLVQFGRDYLALLLEVVAYADGAAGGLGGLPP